VETQDQRRLLAFSFANADMLVETDETMAVVYACGAIHSLTGHTESTIIGRNFLDLFPDSERGLVQGVLRRLNADSRLQPTLVRVAGEGPATAPVVLGCYRLEAADRHYYLTLSRARMSAGEEALAARRDAKSGLLNRDDFAKQVGEASKRARELGEDTKLRLVRLEGYEAFRGALTADEEGRLLAELGAMMRGAAVDGRTAGRLGTDRYGILQASEAAEAVLDEQVAVLTRGIDPGGKGARVVGNSIAVPHNGLNEDEAARVLAYAVARFAEPGRRPFTIQTLSDGLRELVAATVAETVRLKDTVASRDMTILLQPIVTLGSRVLHHYEALVRFPGGQSPAHTIGFAEQVGLIHDVDLTICQKVVDLMRMQAQVGSPPQIAVNLSAVSLGSASFIGAFRELLAPHAALRPYLLIEITESMKIVDLEATERVLQVLRHDGHAICLDDFGAGASSFPYVQALTVDYVKIDGAYVKRVLGAGRDEAILKAMVHLCRELGIGIVAEMIETDAQEAKLLALGVQYGQGYLFGRPDQGFRAGPSVREAERRGTKRR